MTIAPTARPAGVDRSAGLRRRRRRAADRVFAAQVLHRQVDAAQFAPLDSARSRATVAPVASTTASSSTSSASAGTSPPTVTPGHGTGHPLPPSAATRRSTTALSSFMLGMPYISSPPIRSARSKTVTRWPAWLSCVGRGEPGRPAADDRHAEPVRDSGGSATIQPFVPGPSAISCSMVLIATGLAVDAPACTIPRRAPGRPAR